MNKHRCDKEDGQDRIDSATYPRLPQGGRHTEAICWYDYLQESIPRAAPFRCLLSAQPFAAALKETRPRHALVTGLFR
jgi:hypothetical protein